jgi:hypothetical protein
MTKQKKKPEEKDQEQEEEPELGLKEQSMGQWTEKLSFFHSKEFNFTIFKGVQRKNKLKPVIGSKTVLSHLLFQTCNI